MVPEGVRVVSAFHTVSAALFTDLHHRLDEDVLVCGDRKADKAQVIELVDRIEGLRAVDCGAAGDGADRRAVHAAADLDQRAQQGPRRHQDHRPARVSATGPVVILAGGTGGAKLARGMLDVVGEQDSIVIANTGDDIEMYGAYVSPDPDLVTLLARRPDRRTRLGPGGRHVRRHGRAARARGRDLVQPR